MRLPPGIHVAPRYRGGDALIAKDSDAYVRIDSSIAVNEAYEIKNRGLEDLRPLCHGDWVNFDWQPTDVMYSGAEHRASPKQCHLTVLPDWQAEWSGAPIVVGGCTMGHDHPPESSAPPAQEVYEFLSYGALLIGSDTWLDLWVGHDGDKVAVPAGCHMTLYNLGGPERPLLTLDFASPDETRNHSNKTRVRQFGPVMLLYYKDRTAHFVLSTNYKGDLPLDAARRQIKIPFVGRAEPGAFLYEQLVGNPGVIGGFAKLGVLIRIATPEVRLRPAGGGPAVSFALPLARLGRPGTALYQYYLGEHEAGADDADPAIIVSREAIAAARRARVAGYSPIERRLTVVVEGAGAWVEKAYRPACEGLGLSGRCSVFYANDSTWAERPAWAADSDLRPWETYLDKADARDLEIYRRLLPDIVFVVTPDRTHSAVARFWAERRAPLVCVEKPFDSRLSNVDSLIASLGLDPVTVTVVLGLDHYQLRARIIEKHMGRIAQHLGGALRRAVFYMMEPARLEEERLSSLQDGLTLDMLPHLFALLPYFGELDSADEIRALDARRYAPLLAAKKDGTLAEVAGIFRGETYSKVEFTFEDYSGNGVRVPCVAEVGKGLIERKYFEILGVSGNTVRVDFSKRPPSADPSCLLGELIFLAGEGYSDPILYEVADPFDPGRTQRITGREQLEPTAEVYRILLEDLLCGWLQRKAMGRTLLLTEAREVVRSLERTWTAIRELHVGREWSTHPVGEYPDGKTRGTATP